VTIFLNGFSVDLAKYKIKDARIPINIAKKENKAKYKSMYSKVILSK
jgi:hypothetical protein